LTDPVDHNALEAGLLGGLTAELTVESDGDRVTNRSVGDIERALNLVDSHRSRTANPSRRSATTVVSFSPE
jgi:hypothetical protein